MIAVVDYGVGNLAGLEAALRRAGAADVRVTGVPAVIAQARAVVLPGVGRFGHCVDELRRQVLDRPVRDARTRGVALLGVCVGMQVLYEASDEDPGAVGLGLAAGRVRRLRSDVRVPHVGWNRVRLVSSHRRLAGWPDDAHFYFVHSFAVEPADRSTVVATVVYGDELVAAVADDGMLGVQFHPEKSGAMGTAFLRSFVSGTGA